jgi:hypothetical protein
MESKLIGQGKTDILYIEESHDHRFNSESPWFDHSDESWNYAAQIE